MPGEGKTTIAVNLAIVLAESLESHALLVDADMRNPRLHHVFELPAGEGLSEFLATGDDIAKYLVKTPVKKLSLIPAGKRGISFPESLASQKMEHLIRELKNRYSDRYVIIDSPPSLIAAETLSLSSMVDGVLLVVRAHHATRSVVQNTISAIGKEQIIGTVLNHAAFVPDEDYYYTYRTYRSYYSDKSKKKR